MKRSVYWLILLVLLAFIGQGNAQKLKYKNIYPIIEAGNFTVAMPLLKEYLQEEPADPSANLYLALIYEERYKGFDPITEYRYSISNAKLAKNRFIQAKVLIDEKEIRRHGDDYFTTFAQKNDRGKMEVFYSTVADKIDKEYYGINAFTEQVPEIYESLANAIDNYEKATKLYGKLNSEYASYEDLVLAHNDSLREVLGKLKSSYEAALEDFDSYQQKLKQYPLKGYNQALKVHRIKDFKIDGVSTYEDFLKDSVDVWDYATWVKSLQYVIDHDIAPLRDGIKRMDKNLEENFKYFQASAGPTKKTIDPVQWDMSTLRLLSIYDPFAYIRPVLDYKLIKQFLLMGEMSVFEGIDSIDASYISLANENLKLLTRVQEAYEKLEGINERMSPTAVRQYDGYLSKTFSSVEGVKSFIKQEKAFLAKERKAIKGRITDALAGELVYQPVVDSIQIDTMMYALKDVNISKGYSKHRFYKGNPHDFFWTYQYKKTDTAGVVTQEGHVAYLDTARQIIWDHPVDSLTKTVLNEVEGDSLETLQPLVSEGYKGQLNVVLGLAKYDTSGNVTWHQKHVLLDTTGQVIESPVSFDVANKVTYFRYSEPSHQYMAISHDQSGNGYKIRALNCETGKVEATKDHFLIDAPFDLQFNGRGYVMAGKSIYAEGELVFSYLTPSLNSVQDKNFVIPDMAGFQPQEIWLLNEDHIAIRLRREDNYSSKIVLLDANDKQSIATLDWARQ